MTDTDQAPDENARAPIAVQSTHASSETAVKNGDDAEDCKSAAKRERSARSRSRSRSRDARRHRYRSRERNYRRSRRDDDDDDYDYERRRRDDDDPRERRRRRPSSRSRSRSPRDRRARSPPAPKDPKPPIDFEAEQKLLQLTTRTGGSFEHFSHIVVFFMVLKTACAGAYIPPARLRALQDQITDKSSEAYQRMTWDALKKSINGLINKVWS